MDQLDLRNIVDIGLVAIGLWMIMIWLRQARAGLAVLGALTLAAVYLAAREFRLELTAWMFQGFFAVFLIIVIIVLQNDLRRTFERIGRWGLGNKGSVRAEQQTVGILCHSVFELADRSWGALVVLPGRDILDPHLEGGHTLFGSLSHALLISLFDPDSPGHDGAVVVEGDRVSRFGVHLPLSSNFRELRDRGTRHSAALGLSEVSDAACIVASEERGEVMVARHGRLHAIETVEALEKTVIQHLDEVSPEGASPRRRRFAIRRYGLEAAVALMLSLGLWWLFVSGPELSERTFSVPVQVENIDPSYEVEAVDPQEVEIVLRGEARDLFLLDPTELRVRLDASGVPLRQRIFQISARDVRHPEALTVGAVSPPAVLLRLRQTEEAPAGRVDAPVTP